MSEVGAGQDSIVRSFLRTYRDDIITEWTRVVKVVPDARELHSHALLDHIPAVVDEIADIVEDLGRGPAEFETARRHALDRLGEGFDISSVVSELSILRGAILTIWARENVEGSLAELSALNLAVDRAITASVTRYAEARERTLTGIDRVSTVTLEATDVEDLLVRLLHVFKETTPAVDTVAVLLAKQGRLVGRAAVGLEAGHVRELDIPIGEGFEGMVASIRQPIEVAEAYRDPSVTSETLRSRKVLAMYGLPLIHEGNLIGVAHMGSLTAPTFSQEDRHLFASMAARATTGIVHQLLRQELSVSERRSRVVAAERERALAKLEALLAASPVGIGFVDRELRFVRINDALARINDLPARDHIGRTVMEMYPDLASKLEPIMRHVLTTGEPAINLEVTRKSRKDPAERHFLLATYFPVRSDTGSITGVGGIILDVTERKEMEEQLRIALRIREELLAVVSHDLRGPLGTIQLSASLLLSQFGTDQRALRHLDVINRNVGRMANLINDLLDSAKIRAGRLQLALQRENVESVVNEAVELQQSLAEEKRVQLVVKCDVEGVDIECDRGRILQVFGNLIGNAIKFCRAGDSITITAVHQEDEVRFCVADTGPGIEAEVVPRLFDAYWSGAEHAKEGTGLGLFIVRGIIERHGGKIWVESTPGQGAQFLFTLPVAR